MSAFVNGQNISLTRGDSLILHISVRSNGREYTPELGDTIRFALKKTISDGDPLIIKNADLENMLVELEPSDTKELAYGTYVYDIELTTADGYVDTFIGPAKFKLTEEVY